MGHQPKQIYEFGLYRLDAAERLLMRDGAVVPLQPKVFDLLLALVERHGSLLEKDELMELVWPDTVVEEANLANNISILRKTLGENGHQFIETVPKRGYRFVTPVRKQAEEPSVIEDTLPSMATERQDASSSALPRRRISRLVRRRPGLTALLLILLLAGIASAFGYRWLALRPPPPASNVAIKSIAVLPFKPLVAESHDEALQMGMADTLILKISGLKQLSVRSINSVRKYANPDQDPLAAGREQRVDFVLDSSFQRDGDRIRVMTRLLNVADGTALFSFQCDEEYCANFLVMQDAISEKVAAALSLHLTREERERLRKHYTDNKEAYQLYLKGRHFWSKTTLDTIKKGIECFQQAIGLDANYALAYAGLADSYIVLGQFFDVPPKEAMPKAREAAVKALTIDDTLAEAHVSLATVKAWYDWDWSGAEQEFKQAINLDPQFAMAYDRYAYYLVCVGRQDESLAAIKRAQELDPISLPIRLNAGWILCWTRQSDRAIEHGRQMLEMDPNFCMAGNVIAIAYLNKGMGDEAIAECFKVLTCGGYDRKKLAALKTAYAAGGVKGFLEKNLSDLKEDVKGTYVKPMRFAERYAILGDKDQAMAWIEKGYDDHDSYLINVKLYSVFDFLHTDPRFAKVLRGMNLEP